MLVEGLYRRRSRQLTPIDRERADAPPSVLPTRSLVAERAAARHSTSVVRQSEEEEEKEGEGSWKEGAGNSMRLLEFNDSGAAVKSVTPSVPSVLIHTSTFEAWHTCGEF